MITLILFIVTNLIVRVVYSKDAMIDNNYAEDSWEEMMALRGKRLLQLRIFNYCALLPLFLVELFYFS